MNPVKSRNPDSKYSLNSLETLLMYIKNNCSLDLNVIRDKSKCSDNDR